MKSLGENLAIAFGSVGFLLLTLINAPVWQRGMILAAVVFLIGLRMIKKKKKSC
ncbi:hypothetical protein MFMK1_000998 [Metallumcola ferriviriculae]|uniref:PEP-CTERM protein-sorting domain-containing protein n=1 Tax=Metallumcola ferriviriculae TaxID=3039180 RepID=A0AAU0ULW2_9FIRM|nr:hypothetical protein MFMK1_000998 [Desulfitibacteraceae bacterium MK1]